MGGQLIIEEIGPIELSYRGKFIFVSKETGDVLLINPDQNSDIFCLIISNADIRIYHRSQIAITSKIPQCPKVIEERMLDTINSANREQGIRDYDAYYADNFAYFLDGSVRNLLEGFLDSIYAANKLDDSGVYISGDDFTVLIIELCFGKVSNFMTGGKTIMAPDSFEGDALKAAVSEDRVVREEVAKIAGWVLEKNTNYAHLDYMLALLRARNLAKIESPRNLLGGI